MPNVAKVLKEEIARVARKEIKLAIARIAKPTAKSRRTQAELKRRLAALEKQSKVLAAALGKVTAVQPVRAAEEDKKIRVTAKGMRSLRRKLRLSQAEFGKLLSVSEQAVYMWERRNGAIRVRDTTRANLMAIRDFGAREARQRLEGMGVKRARRGGKRR